ncbi:glycosyltransferase [Methylobacterium sp. PvR107]|uniref:glycosyltransferase n=1 Tax=Methylobacterium sp. PvR107 TaxID=2806597 RepID=UPI001AE724CC|nr:glycosyltransferase [Methylobacterium sp. PvR107]MBP1178531.1 glycosyltransferase involved in cell wall biosynthesis [Methylobacterium sp. PvR107]
MIRIAIVSTSVPPAQSGQALVIGRLLATVPPQAYAFLSVQPSLQNSTAGAEPTWRHIQLQPPVPPAALSRLLSSTKTLNQYISPFAIILKRAREISENLKADRPEVLIACSGDPYDIGATMLAAQRLKVPFALYLFDDPVFQWPAGPLRRIAQLLEKFWAPRAKLAFLPNEMLRDDFQKRQPKTPTLVVRNPAHEDAFRISQGAQSSAQTWPKKIVYTGSVYHAQGDAFRNLIEALDLLEGRFELHVYSSQTQEAFTRQGVLGRNVIRHDAVEPAEALQIQSSSDILFLPLGFDTGIDDVIRSSAPGKTAEYLSSGRPILVHAPADSFIVDLFRKHDCGFVVDHPNPVTLALALERISHDRPRVAAVTENALTLAGDFRAERSRAIFWDALSSISNASATTRPPRILFVAMHHSIHVARWIATLQNLGWDLHMFPLDGAPPNENLSGVTLHWPEGPDVATIESRSLTIATFSANLDLIDGYEVDAEGRVKLGESNSTSSRTHGPHVLNSVIERVKPDLIHSMEFQHAGYLVLRAKELFSGQFPPWLATNWGSDIFLFGREEAHHRQITRLLSQADFYSCECGRDVGLAREYGFRNTILPILPNSGGLDLERVNSLRSGIFPSQRKIIMVKGYDHFAGRAMVSLGVLESLADKLKDYEIVLFSVSSRPRTRALELSRDGILNTRVIDYATHDEILSLFSRARIYLGVSISDGISTSVLEAMSMGAFPIQTNTSCSAEWFNDGSTGFSVSPDDADRIRECFRIALSDDQLVDEAARVNRRIVADRLDRRVLSERVREFYDIAFKEIAADTQSIP